MSCAELFPENADAAATVLMRCGLSLSGDSETAPSDIRKAGAALAEVSGKLSSVFSDLSYGVVNDDGFEGIDRSVETFYILKKYRKFRQMELSTT